MKPLSLLFLAAAPLVHAQTVETATVVSQTVARKSRLPGELYPFMKVALQARITGFVESIDVDRGSAVKKDQVIARLSAPEIKAQIAEAQAKVRAVEAQRAEAEARVAAAQNTYDRLKAASATPGVIAANELVQAEKSLDAAKAVILSLNSAVEAARSAIHPLRELESYLDVKAPFDGIVTDRQIHPGALVGPGAGANNLPLVVIEQHSRLRLVIAVPEADAGGIARGANVAFKVPAWPGQTFSGTVSRLSNAMDAKTRTMPVELDVTNPRMALAPGMYAEADWPVRRTRPSLMVPATAVVTTTERSFVVRVNNGRAEWVNVSKGAMSGELVEVMGAIEVGDVVVKRATDEIRDGSPVAVKR
ncbi:MAG: efflux RND transporter periplasmic adaptor subunit [Acidobacteria bacterium]|nr:efflux RND transporter periplasmic adaptor subunit [Acidobacteriota bacterium]